MTAPLRPQSAELSELELRAIAFAAKAHSCQVDKAGHSYLAHPFRVAMAVRSEGEKYFAVGMLHDVPEDTDATLAEITAEFGTEIGEAVESLTRRKKTNSYESDVIRAMINPIGRKVKPADVADNERPERIGLLEPATQERLRKKYAIAHKVFKECAGVGESPAVAPQTQNQPRREGICQDCGREYGVWFAPNEIWNLVIPERVGMFCPICFMTRADHAAISFTGWELRPENFSERGRGRKDDDSSERRETSNLDNAGSSPAVPSNSSWSEMMATQLPCGHTNAEHMYYAELTCSRAAAPAAPIEEANGPDQG